VIKVADGSGFCSGVKRAIGLAFSSSEKGKNIYTLGPIIHNPQVVSLLKEKGVLAVSSIDNIPSGIVIFRSHGVLPDDYKKAKEKDLTILDGTCPIVARVQSLAKSLFEDGYTVVILGDPNHPEVKAIVGNAPSSIVIKKPEDAMLIKKKKIGLISQTTQSMGEFKKIASIILDRVHCLKIYNTICKAVLRLQEKTISLAEKSDVFFVIGGKTSANTKRLFDLSCKINPNVYHVERKDEIKPQWLTGKKRIGITAGTSTPPWVIDEVVEKIKLITQN